VRGLDACGAVLFALASWATLADLYQPIGIYDEALLLTNADAILHGAAPYRDFYSNYPPGLFYLLAGIWRVFSVHALVARWLGLAIHVGLALVCGALAGRLVGRRFLWLAAGLVMTVLVPFHLVANAYLAAVTTLLGAIAVFVAPGARPARAFAAGLLLGATSALRHDLFLMFGAAASACGALAWLTRPWRPSREDWRRFGWLAAGAALPVALVWLPTFASAGFATVAGDLYFDQVRYVLPARTLPAPPLFEATPHPWLPGRLPAFLVSPFAAGLVAAWAGLLLASASGLRAHRRGGDAVTLLFLAIVSGIGVFHMFGRTDVFHVLFALPVPLLLASALATHAAQRGPLGALAAAALVLWLLQPGAVPTEATQRLWPPAALRAPPAANTLGIPRVGAILDPAPGPRRAILTFIQTHAKPGEPIFVGQPEHDRIILNDLLFYFLADRRGATRYQQFDPGLTTRAEVQREMVADLEAKRPPVVVLTPRYFAPEPNRSRERGARLLDEYIASHYELRARVGRYQLLLRKPS
jgi:hypothetical protein